MSRPKREDPGVQEYIDSSIRGLRLPLHQQLRHLSAWELENIIIRLISTDTCPNGPAALQTLIDEHVGYQQAAIDRLRRQRQTRHRAPKKRGK
jgi:hypothetical protein